MHRFNAFGFVCVLAISQEEREARNAASLLTEFWKVFFSVVNLPYGVVVHMQRRFAPTVGETIVGSV